jgi:hypothetical protein
MKLMYEHFFKNINKNTSDFLTKLGILNIINKIFILLFLMEKKIYQTPEVKEINSIEFLRKIEADEIFNNFSFLFR